MRKSSKIPVFKNVIDNSKLNMFKILQVVSQDPKHDQIWEYLKERGQILCKISQIISEAGLQCQFSCEEESKVFYTRHDCVTFDVWEEKKKGSRCLGYFLVALWILIFVMQLRLWVLQTYALKMLNLPVSLRIKTG